MAKSNSKAPKRKFLPWVYDLILWLCSLCIEIFFREIRTRASFQVPSKGPLIIVAGPHANQFVDSIILMRVLKAYSHRRISFLIAEKSMHEPYIGTLAGLCGALPVARAQDNVKPGVGKICFADVESDPTLIQGIDTDFKHESVMVGGTVVFPKVGKTSPASGIIAEIISRDKLKLKKPVELPDDVESTMAKGESGGGVSYKLAPHIDQTKVFDAASAHLLRGGCIGIFPEGGSHDRTSLLPLKAGVSIMALSTLALDPNCGLSIVPCGMNYFHAHKFRSRAVVEFGPAIDVHPDQIKAYKAGGSQKRNAIGSLLETINEGLVAVTQSTPDYETLMLVQATRRLYNPIGKKLPLSAVVELNRRLIKGYNQFKDHPRLVALKKNVLTYNRRLKNLGIRDHQVEWGDIRNRPWWLTFGTLVYRIVELAVLAAGTLPGLLLFWPIFVITKIISLQKQKKALAGSSVKIRGRDVMSTWKLLVSIGLAPALYASYTFILTAWLYHNRNQGQHLLSAPRWLRITTYVPDFVPLWTFPMLCLLFLISITFAALRIGEIGMDILKSLPPLFVALNPFTSNTLSNVRKHRQELAAEVNDVINTFGPKIFDNFDQTRIIADPYAKERAYQSRLKSFDDDDDSLNNDNDINGDDDDDDDDGGRTSFLSESFDLTSPFEFVSSLTTDSSKTK